MKVTTRVLLSVALGGTLVATTAPLAEATTRNGTCETGEACVWEDDGKEGGIFDAFYYASDYSDWNYIGRDRSLDNSVSSVQNRDTGKALWMYQHARGGGIRNSTAIGAYDSDLGNDGFEDRASSHCWNYSNAPTWCA